MPEDNNYKDGAEVGRPKAEASPGPLDAEVVEREPLLDASWQMPTMPLEAAGEYERQAKQAGVDVDQNVLAEKLGLKPVHLEKVVLSNGIRYVVIRDTATNDQVFNNTEYVGLLSCDCGEIHESPVVASAKATKDVDLGKGYRLKMILAAKAGKHTTEVYEGGVWRNETHSYPEHTTSYVEKTVHTTGENGIEVEHVVDYYVTPEEENYSLLYTYQGDKTISIRASKYGGEQRKTSVVVFDPDSGDQVDFIFDATGNLARINIAGRYLLDQPDSQKEFLALTEESQRGVMLLEDTKLNSPLARSLLIEELQLPPTDVTNVRLDVNTIFAVMLDNIDRPPHQNPVKTLPFIK